MRNLFISLLLLFSIGRVSADNIPFSLKNNTPRSIYLLIPGVMNPNISPFSWSGVNLEEGQKIYFVFRGEQYVLLEVDATLRDKRISVNRLIKKRKKELGLR